MVPFRELGPHLDPDRLNVVFVIVDPERDTLESTRDYFGSFDPHIPGFIGTQAQLAALAAAFKVQCRRVPLDGGDYTIDHTVAVLLMDTRGRFAGTVTSEDDEKAIQARLESLVRSASRSAGGSITTGRLNAGVPTRLLGPVEIAMACCVP